MSDPSDTGVPPNRATVELALRVAQREVRQPGPAYDVANRYWQGAVEALQWVVGQRTATPASDQDARADLDHQRCPVVRREAVYAYECMNGQRRQGDGMDLRYLTGVENTLMWVVTGDGFAGPLDPQWLRENYGIE